MRTTLLGCTVELSLPGAVDVSCDCLHAPRPATIKIEPRVYIEDLKIQLGDSRSITIKKVLLHITGEMVPVLTDYGLAYFDAAEEVKPDVTV